jgi:hypothetical protein
MRKQSLIGAALLAAGMFGLVLGTKWTLEAADQPERIPAFGEQGGGGGGRGGDSVPAFDERRGGGGSGD